MVILLAFCQQLLPCQGQLYKKQQATGSKAIQASLPSHGHTARLLPAEGEEVRPHAERDVDKCIVGVWQSHLGFMHKLCSETQVSAIVGLEKPYMSATRYSDVL